LPQTDLARVQSAFTTGTIDGACNDIGGVHENAAGYATIDVVGNCSANTPRDRAYWGDARYTDRDGRQPRRLRRRGPRQWMLRRGGEE
jgi:hypothetical protein